MIRQLIPEFREKEHVIILCDSWYTKQNLVSIVDEYPNLDLIVNARIDSVMYELTPARTGRRGRPAKHGRRLSVENDFTFLNEKMGGCYTGVYRVITRIFDCREVLAYVTATSKENGTKRLFLSTFFQKICRLCAPFRKKMYLPRPELTRKNIPTVFVLITLEHRNQLLWAENFLVFVQLYGKQLQKHWDDG